jgi:lysophospholipid acyltransferase (LPLAT)-like uncharacterized protein
MSEAPRQESLLGRIGAVLLRALGSTWRVRLEGHNPLDLDRAPQIGAFWHRNLLIAAFLFRDRGCSVPVSRSRDGGHIASALVQLGYRTPPRGSSSIGGAAALRQLVRMVQSGVTVSVQPDGPRGPARRSKPGVVALARLTGVAITPVAISARPCVRFRSWDGTLLPVPFARVVCRFGSSLAVAGDADPEQEKAHLGELDRVLNRDTDALDERLSL